VAHSFCFVVKPPQGGFFVVWRDPMKPPEEISIRSVTHGELPRLLEMIHALAAHHGDTATLTLDELRRDVRGASPWFKVLVAARREEFVGYAAMSRLGQLQFARRGMDLHHLYVEPEHRQQGIGRALMQAAVRTAKDSNCSYITLGAAPHNTEAQQIYLNFGFADVASGGRRFRLELGSR
jgi:ribosomal protein S18 acetylase RimI-like enzyme